MANISYNNLSSPSNILTFTEVPNILKVEENVQGQKCIIELKIENGLRYTVTADSQYNISMFGEVITNAMSPSDAVNRRFFIANDAQSTAMGIVKALRECSNLSADFNVFGDSNGYVYVVAKTIGNKIVNANDIQTNIPNQYMTIEITDGSSSSSLFNSKIDVDVYSGTPSFNTYITTLEKNFYGSECAFDVSPVLATFSQYGKTKPYVFNISAYGDNGEFYTLGSMSGNTAIGYLANQSQKYLVANGVQTLINNSRGRNGQGILYVYEPTIPYTVLRNDEVIAWNVNVYAKDSAFNVIWSGSSVESYSSDSLIEDYSVSIPQTAFTSAYYIDLEVDGKTTRFNVTKPLKATDYCQRVLWRNEYGGISFFDFTSARRETDNVEIETYEKNVFDYYVTNEFEKKKIYKNSYNKSVSLTSHILQEDGKWIFNSLMRSKKVWTIVNGSLFYIIPKTIDVAEDQTYNNIYTATLTYEYSDIA